jgi:hypothetical protein
MKQEIHACFIVLLTLLGSARMQAGVDTTPNTFATFIGQDRATNGTWKGSYGQDGYLIVGESIQVPSYSTFDPHSSVNISVQDYWSSDPRALLKAHPSYSPSERIASYFHSLNTMQIDVSTTDNQPHRIALYFADYDRAHRTAVVQAVDTLTGAIYDYQQISRVSDSFGQSPVYENGVYLVYRYQGRITFKISSGTAGLQPAVYRDTYGHPCVTMVSTGGSLVCAPGNPPTVALSCIFWGGTAAPIPFASPYVSISAPTAGTFAGIVNLQAQAFAQLLNYEDAYAGYGIQSVQFMLDGQKIGPQIGSGDRPFYQTYSFAWDTSTVPSGAHVLTAVARDGMGNSVESTPRALNVDNSVIAPPASGTWAKVIGFDAITAGDWKRAYGQDGNVIAQSSVRVPSYSTFDSRNSANSLLRNLFSYDERALVKQFPNYVPYERVESEFSNMTFMEFLVSTTDNQAHRLALYFCDWDRLGRTVLVEARDAVSGAVLATNNISGYPDGSYLVFRYRGPIILRITNLAPAGANRPAATVSGFFWGGGGPY